MINKDKQVNVDERLNEILENNENPVFELIKNKGSKELARKYATYLYKIRGKTPEDIEDMFDNMGGGIPYETLVNVKEEFLKIYNK